MKMRFFLFILFVFILGTGTSNITMAAVPDLYIFNGYVVDATGNPLSGDVIIHTPGGNISGSIVDGLFTIKSEAPGSVYVSIYITGYEVYNKWVNVGEDEYFVFWMTRAGDDVYSYPLLQNGEGRIIERMLLYFRRD